MITVVLKKNNYRRSFRKTGQKTIFLETKVGYFKTASTSKCLSLTLVRFGLSTSFLNENRLSTAALDGTTGLCFTKNSLNALWKSNVANTLPWNLCLSEKIVRQLLTAADFLLLFRKRSPKNSSLEDALRKLVIFETFCFY